jgi:hypothetical protein
VPFSVTTFYRLFVVIVVSEKTPVFHFKAEMQLEYVSSRFLRKKWKFSAKLPRKPQFESSRPLNIKSLHKLQPPQVDTIGF